VPCFAKTKEFKAFSGLFLFQLCKLGHTLQICASGGVLINICLLFFVTASPSQLHELLY